VAQTDFRSVMCGSTPCALGSEKQNFTTDLNLIYASDHEPLLSKKHGKFFHNVRHTLFTVYRRLFPCHVSAEYDCCCGFDGWEHNELNDVGS
jgi:hypothetical protein